MRQRARLNREIVSAAFGMAQPMLAYKAEETATRLHRSRTRQRKPSQRCSACWEIVPKTLAERMHVCPHCGRVQPRDRNSALGVLVDAHTPETGMAARPKPLPRQRGKSSSLTRETPATTPCVARREISSRQKRTLMPERAWFMAAAAAWAAAMALASSSLIVHLHGKNVRMRQTMQVECTRSARYKSKRARGQAHTVTFISSFNALKAHS